MSPQEILLKNEQIIEMIHIHHYIPSKDHGMFSEVVDALKQIDPRGVYKTDCSGCIMEMARMAKIHLDAYKASLPKAVFHTFPKQDYPTPEYNVPTEIATEKKHKGRKPGSKNKK